MRPIGFRCLTPSLRSVVFALFAAVWLAGCSTPLPRHPGLSPQQAWATYLERQHRIESLRGRVELTLTDADGKRRTLDGAVAVRADGHARLQLGRLGRDALDLTRRPDGVWLWVSPQVSEQRSALENLDDARGRERHPMAAFADALVWLVRPPIDEIANATATPRQPKGRLVFRSAEREATLKRETLLLTEVRAIDSAEGPGWSVSFEDHRLDPATGLVFSPEMRLDLRDNATDDRFAVTLRMSRPELNAAIPDTAFGPRRGAEPVSR